ncbi:MAG: exodeoxyribonuclease VII small subunit [Hyphomicrobiales bacterium]
MSKAPAKSGDIASMSFEQALGELEAIVAKLEAGKVELEESIAIYERGEALRAHCDKLLKSAEAKVEKIRLDGENRPAGTVPLDGAD